MYELIDNDKANNVADETVLRGAPDSGDDGAVAIRRDGRWVFVSRATSYGGERTPVTVLDRLYGRAYEVLRRPPGHHTGLAVGQILDKHQVNKLPVGSVVGKFHDNLTPPVGIIVHVVEAGSLFRWFNRGGEPSVYHKILVDDWELLRIGTGEPPAPAEVGDVIDTEGKAAALPVGTVLSDDDDNNGGPGEAPAVKVGPDRWMYYSEFGDEARFDGDDLVVDQPHRVVSLPATAVAA